MQRYIIALCVLGAAFVYAGGDDNREWTGKPWMGKWESTGRQENLKAFVDKLGVHSYMAHSDPNQKTWSKFFKVGDEYHHKIVVPSANYTNDIAFKFDEQRTGSVNNTQFTYKYTEKDGALVGHFTYGGNVTLENCYKLDGEELVKTGKVGGVEAKRWYKKAEKH